MSYNKQENYCSCSPDSILGCTYNYGCYLHDRQYRNEVKCRKTRKQADQQLRDVIYKILKNSSESFEIRLIIPKYKINKLFFKSDLKFFISLRRLIAYPWSRLYYYAVRLFAWRAWDE